MSEDPEKEAKIDALKTHAATNQTFARAKKIAKMEKWEELGVHEDCIWGIAIGSSGNYNVMCRVGGEAVFSDDACSCPSRERPCKHGIALALMHIRDEEPWPNEPASTAFLESIDASKDLGYRETHWVPYQDFME